MGGIIVKKVLLSEKIDDSGIKLLKDNGFDVIVSKGIDTKNMKDGLKDAYGVIMRSTPLNKEMIDAAPNLKIIARTGTGFNSVDIDEANKKGILVARVNGANSNAVAEYVLTTMLILSRKIAHANSMLREKKNELAEDGSLPNFAGKYDLNGHELKGKTLAILGLGHVGRITARFAEALGMKVIGYDPYLKQNQVKWPLLDDINDIYPQADFLSINMPLTDETKNMISMKQIKMMKNSAIIINSARGGIVNEHDLAEALNNNLLAGAALDSFNPEPPTPDNPLFNAKNLIMTPHMAGTTIEAWQALSTGAAQAIVDYANGKMPQFPVNPDVIKK
ncbi:4-phosphoerythronate dehydrogenase [Lactobacillus crispatus]|jgi:D-3-phosphoglycerate dehydrogenase|nr:4-phosphoerythronate dehydrogenase [Lactobacillus crispatus]PEG82213.1 4-phosphoerythronate dehydrogenase [Lactobacillus sp. UMNPBX16]PEG84229.1 4-phosphoerythronate dehydrogenase [Lactobacillus sp. UMNPBX15]OXC47389.1 4-phosphoerythronate dehydrogenase [Lactobacillus crispatus]OXC48370.1 4-phosphoerythronate dehydrogenase [Lactobacillus crispatus]